MKLKITCLLLQNFVDIFALEPIISQSVKFKLFLTKSFRSEAQFARALAMWQGPDGIRRWLQRKKSAWQHTRSLQCLIESLCCMHFPVDNHMHWYQTKSNTHIFSFIDFDAFFDKDNHHLIYQMSVSSYLGFLLTASIGNHSRSTPSFLIL